MEAWAHSLKVRLQYKGEAEAAEITLGEEY